MDLAQYIAQNALIDKYIPIILLIAGIAGAVGIMGVNADAVVQGVLVTGTTVYTNQLIKQTTKKQ